MILSLIHCKDVWIVGSYIFLTINLFFGILIVLISVHRLGYVKLLKAGNMLLPQTISVYMLCSIMEGFIWIWMWKSLSHWIVSWAWEQ